MLPGNIYGTALADMYSRGMSISPNNPWALAQSTFPMAMQTQPGITPEQLISGARNYLTQQPMPTFGPMSTPQESLSALDQLMPGMTGPDVPMSEDTSLGGRIAALNALNDPVGVPGIALSAMGLFSGPFGPIGAKVAKSAIKWHLNREIQKEIEAILGKAAEPDLPMAGNRDVAPTGDPTAPGAPDAPDDGPPGSVSIGDITATDPATGLSMGGLTAGGQATAGDPSGAAAAGAAAAAAAGEGGSTGVGTGEGPAGESGGVGGGAYKKGGIVKKPKGKPAQHGQKFHPGFARNKGSHVVPIKAHEGEFVVNSQATKAARPALEALNYMIPPEGLDKLIGKANKFFDAS